MRITKLSLNAFRETTPLILLKRFILVLNQSYISGLEEINIALFPFRYLKFIELLKNEMIYC